MSVYNNYVVQVFRGHLDQYTPDMEYHDKFEEGKLKKQPLPPGLSKRDQEVLISVRSGYHWLDESFHIFGIYFGWSLILSVLLPVFGTLIEFSLAHRLVIYRAERATIPNWLKSEMMMNLFLGTALGLIPIAGRIISAMFGLNTRNDRLFEEYMRLRGAVYIKLRGSEPIMAEKSEGREWWDVLAEKAAPTITRRDLNLIKPGHSMTIEEVQQVEIVVGAPGDQV